MTDSDLVRQCHFPPAGTAVALAVSGGPDSMGLLVLSLEAGLAVTVHHVDHHARAASDADATFVASFCAARSLPFVRHDVLVSPGPNFDQRARYARRGAMPDGVLTGHTMDDVVETMLLNMMRGTGPEGLISMFGDPTKPLLSLRRAALHDYVAAAGVAARIDESNHDPRYRRNRVRHELLPLLNDIAERDVTPLLARLGHVLQDEQGLLDASTEADARYALGEVDCRDLRTWPTPRLKRWLRGVLRSDGEYGDSYAPSVAEIERVLAVVRGDVVACELSGGRRLARKDQRLTLQ